MIAKVLSSAVLGVDAYLVEVEVDIALGFLDSFGADIHEKTWTFVKRGR